MDANTAFDQYREMYFEGGVSSVYLWDCEHVDHGDCDHGDHDFAGRLNSEHQLSPTFQELFLSRMLVAGTQTRSRAAGTLSM